LAIYAIIVLAALCLVLPVVPDASYSAILRQDVDTTQQSIVRTGVEHDQGDRPLRRATPAPSSAQASLTEDELETLQQKGKRMLDLCGSTSLPADLKTHLANIEQLTANGYVRGQDKDDIVVLKDVKATLRPLRTGSAAGPEGGSDYTLDPDDLVPAFWDHKSASGAA
jgi:hypothetical protein